MWRGVRIFLNKYRLNKQMKYIRLRLMSKEKRKRGPTSNEQSSTQSIYESKWMILEAVIPSVIVVCKKKIIYTWDMFYRYRRFGLKRRTIVQKLDINITCFCTNCIRKT